MKINMRKYWTGYAAVMVVLTVVGGLYAKDKYLEHCDRQEFSRRLDLLFDGKINHIEADFSKPWGQTNR